MSKLIYLFLCCFIGGYSLTAQEKDLTKPESTEVWEPVPVKVVPGVYNSPPSDAIVLFDGTNLDAWEKEKGGGSIEWLLKDGAMVVKPGTGGIQTKESFGSVQLHLEWLAPVDEGKEGQGYSNSGVFFMGKYEVQILNSYENITYPNGQAGSIYKQHIPLVNASKPPGEWQTYDIIFNAPVFGIAGNVKEKASLTVIHNGVLLHHNAILEGPTVYIGLPKYEAHMNKLPIMLQDHGDMIRFRNIWLRPL